MFGYAQHVKRQNGHSFDALLCRLSTPSAVKDGCADEACVTVEGAVVQVKYVPFNPVDKFTINHVQPKDGSAPLRIMKGAPQVRVPGSCPRPFLLVPRDPSCFTPLHPMIQIYLMIIIIISIRILSNNNDDNSDDISNNNNNNNNINNKIMMIIIRSEQ